MCSISNTLLAQNHTSLCLQFILNLIWYHNIIHVIIVLLYTTIILKYTKNVSNLIFVEIVQSIVLLYSHRWQNRIHQRKRIVTMSVITIHFDEMILYSVIIKRLCWELGVPHNYNYLWDINIALFTLIYIR